MRNIKENIMKKILWCIICTMSLNCMESTSSEKRFILIDEWTMLSKQRVSDMIYGSTGYAEIASLCISQATTSIASATTAALSWLWGSGSQAESPKESTTNPGDQFFEFLATIKIPNGMATADGLLFIEGRKTPPILCAYFLTQNPEEEDALHLLVHKALDAANMMITQKNLFKRCVDFIFRHKEINPLIAIRPECIELLKEAKNAGHQCIFLGNMPSYSYDHIMRTLDKKEQGPSEDPFGIFNSGNRTTIREIFDIDKHINEQTVFVSGRLGKLTNHPDVLKQIMKLHNATPQQCLVIGDHEGNLKSAQQLKMPTVCVEDAKQLQGELLKLGIIKKIADKQ